LISPIKDLEGSQLWVLRIIKIGFFSGFADVLVEQKKLSMVCRFVVVRPSVADAECKKQSDKEFKLTQHMAKVPIMVQGLIIFGLTYWDAAQIRAMQLTKIMADAE